MTAHKHAALMALAAQDATEIEDWWTRWEFRWPGCNWLTMAGQFAFQSECEYRRKPVMVTRTITYPEPCREVLEMGQRYYLMSLGEVSSYTWHGGIKNAEWFVQGRIHLSREAAEQHRLALLGGGE